MLGHTESESTIGYLSVEVDDALSISEQLSFEGNKEQGISVAACGKSDRDAPEVYNHGAIARLQERTWRRHQSALFGGRASLRRRRGQHKKTELKSSCYKKQQQTHDVRPGFAREQQRGGIQHLQRRSGA